MSPQRLSVRTSEAGWFETVCRAYEEKRSVEVIDDAHAGFTPGTATVWHQPASPGFRRGLAAAVAFLVAAVGTTMLFTFGAVVASLDEPPSVFHDGLWIGAITMLLGVGFAVRSLTRARPPRITSGSGEAFEVSWSGR